MKHLLKYCTFSFFLILVLSLKINNETIFNHIYRPLSSFVIPGQKMAESFIYKGAKSTQKISTDIFKNSIPKLKDSVKASLSAPLKNTVPLENVSNQDRGELNNLLK